MPGPHDAEQASGDVADEGDAPQVPKEETVAGPAAPSGEEPGEGEPGEPASRYEPL